VIFSEIAMKGGCSEMIRNSTFAKRSPLVSSLLIIVTAVLIISPLAWAKHFGEWGAPVNAESIPGTSSELNTPSNDGCPIQSPDGLSLFIASNRPGGFGGQDIWVAHRASKDDPWGAPEHLPEPVNSSVDDFCPTPVRGHGLFFVSARSGGCGGADIYFTRLSHDGWEQPQNLGCEINSSAGEASPSYFEDEDGNAFLYFSSNRVGGAFPDVGMPDSDIYFSLNFGPAQLAPGLNTAVDDSRPNVRKDGREIVFDSTRPLTIGLLPDIWTASRESINDDWATPVHLEPPINTSASETRASLSWDGLTMVFGSNRPGGEGMADVYVTKREKLLGKGH
jgi:WD40-like Beta Propeller Repeat